jgi:hypothetical protein
MGFPVYVARHFRTFRDVHLDLSVLAVAAARIRNPEKMWRSKSDIALEREIE